jgi:N-acetyl-anhydromuramyl-L-alanine amidase AmpD
MRDWEKGFKFIETPNFWKGRKGWRPKAIVLHITDGSLKSAINTITNPEKQVSYHYIVAKDGSIYKFVDIDDTAWHCGKVVNPTWELIIEKTNPNFYTIGVACEGREGELIEVKQFIALVVLLTFICRETKIYPNANTFVYHREIRADKTCPAGYINKHSLLLLVQNIFERLEEK